MIKVQLLDLLNRMKEVKIDKFPDTCPACHHSLVPHFMCGSVSGDTEMSQIVFRCTRDECHVLFIGVYLYDKAEGLYLLFTVNPKSVKAIEFSEEINEVSPSFVKIYNQCLVAEVNELDQITGIGFRKALEFLVKDFATMEKPDLSEQISKNFLGSVIKDYIDDGNIKTCAERAAWLGNDEAHYIRKWGDKDIKDLKVLVKLTLNWIENVILTRKYEREMNKG
jgi:hypothetical protein